MKTTRAPYSLVWSITFFLLAHASAMPVVVNATDADDTVVVTANSAQSGSYRVNGGPAISFRDATSFTFNGGNGNDTLRVVNPPQGLFAPTSGIFCNGGTE